AGEEAASKLVAVGARAVVADLMGARPQGHAQRGDLFLLPREVLFPLPALASLRGQESVVVPRVFLQLPRVRRELEDVLNRGIQEAPIVRDGNDRSRLRREV